MKFNFTFERIEKIKPSQLFVFLLVLAGAVYSLLGFQGTLYFDDAFYIQGGRFIVEGTPPYASFLATKTPLSQFIAAFALLLGRKFGAGDILSVRIIFFILSSLGAASIYLLGRQLFDSNRLGIIACLTFLGFYGFGRHAASGPRPKGPLILFESLTLFLAARRDWFWSAFFGGLMTLTWQPTLIYPAFVIYLSFVQSPAGEERKKNLGRAAAGFSLPILVLSAYMLKKGAFRQMIKDTLYYPVTLLERGSNTFSQRLLQPILTVELDYTDMSLPILLGFVMMIVLIVWRLSAHQYKLKDFINQDPLAALSVTFSVLVVWSILDFQGFADLYILLPGLALGFAWMVELLVAGISSQKETANISILVFIFVCLSLAGFAGRLYTRNSNNVLEKQTAVAEKIAERYLQDPDDYIFTVGVVSYHVLIDSRHSGRYFNLIDAQNKVIEHEYPGGFKKWMKDNMSGDPAAIIVGNILPDSLESWVHEYIQDHGYRLDDSFVFAKEIRPAHVKTWIRQHRRGVTILESERMDWKIYIPVEK